MSAPDRQAQLESIYSRAFSTRPAVDMSGAEEGVDPWKNDIVSEHNPEPSLKWTEEEPAQSMTADVPDGGSRFD